MSYRKANDVGYKKIFPMSLYEDITFCHYCGRGVSPNNGLEWDHVPALNVTIPVDYGLIHQLRKTLVRSCSQCNSLASDTPHLDYIERHLWLKKRYLEKYKSLLLNTSPDQLHTFSASTNKKIHFIELITMLGFGVSDISQISSPVLDMKNRHFNKQVANLIIESLTHPPMTLDEEDETQDGNTEDSETSIDNEQQQFAPVPTEAFIVDFVASEILAGNLIKDKLSLEEWIIKHPSRAQSIGLSLGQIHQYDFNWDSINAQVLSKPIDTETSYYDKSTDEYLTQFEVTLSYLHKQINKTNHYEANKPLPEKNFRIFINQVAFNETLYMNFLEQLDSQELKLYLPLNPEEHYRNFRWRYD